MLRGMLHAPRHEQALAAHVHLYQGIFTVASSTSSPTATKALHTALVRLLQPCMWTVRTLPGHQYSSVPSHCPCVCGKMHNSHASHLDLIP